MALKNQVLFKIRSEIISGELHLYLSGPLNEDSLFTSAPIEQTSRLHIHLDELTTINSTGIRQWLLWVKNYPEGQWQLWGCPPQFINQLNMTDRFIPTKSKVRSFYVPFFSETTNEETQLLIDRENWEKQRNISRPLDSAGNQMEPDFVEDRFFKFSNKY